MPDSSMLISKSWSCASFATSSSSSGLRKRASAMVGLNASDVVLEVGWGSGAAGHEHGDDALGALLVVRVRRIGGDGTSPPRGLDIGAL